MDTSRHMTELAALNKANTLLNLVCGSHSNSSFTPAIVDIFSHNTVSLPDFDGEVTAKLLTFKVLRCSTLKFPILLEFTLVI